MPGRDDIELHSLSFDRTRASGEQQPVLRSVDGTFAVGEIALVRGATGAGKTTLLHVLAGMLRPSGGEVRSGGDAVSRFVGHHRDRWRRRVGVAFQQPQLMADLTVQENVMLPLVPRGHSLAQVRKTASRALAELEIEALAARPAAELSVGESQAVGLARALVAEPAIVLADEPTAHQDVLGVEIVMVALASAKQRGAIVVVACHDPRILAGGWADRVWELRDGELARVDTE